jgi:anti-anti-sigma factor
MLAALNRDDGPNGAAHVDPGAIRVSSEGDDILVIDLEGELDLGNATTFQEEVDGGLQGGKHLILDLTRTTFIDSSVIHVLFRALRTAEGHGRVVVLQLGTERIVERALEIVEIEKAMPRARDRAEAVRLIRKR